MSTSTQSRNPASKTEAPAATGGKAKAKVLTREAADQVKRALTALPAMLADSPEDALKAARMIVGTCVDANPTRLVNVGLSTIDAAKLAHGDLPPRMLLSIYGVGKAKKGEQEAKAAGNLAALAGAEVDELPAPRTTSVQPAQQHKLSAATKKASDRPRAEPKAEDPKVASRRTLVERARVDDDRKNLSRPAASETYGKALDLAEKRFITDGPTFSTNGYLSGVTVPGKSEYVYVDQDGVGWLLRKAEDGKLWVFDLLVRDTAGALRIEQIDGPPCGKSSYAALEQLEGGYDAAKDKRKGSGAKAS